MQKKLHICKKSCNFARFFRAATMIKVYLDWNCITHCKDLWPELKEFLEHYNNVFICPFSEAHIRDVQRKSSCDSEYYLQDLDLLTQISNMNMLQLDGKKLSLYKVTPRDCIKNHVGNYDRIINILTPFYRIVQLLVKSMINQKVLSRISKENSPEKVIPLINGYISKESNASNSVETLLNNFNASENVDIALRVRKAYYFLDLLGYKKEEKSKSLANIDTDAQHIAMASLCDYLISDDSRMRDKAKVIYGQEKCATKVMGPNEFMDMMHEIVEKCNDVDRIPNIIQTNGIPSIHEDGAHYKKIDHPLWGTFNLCLNAASLSSSMPQNEAFFVTDQFMFYDELRPLVNSIFKTLPESKRRELAEYYAQSFIKSIPVDDIPFTIESQKYRYKCVLKKYNNLPALRVCYEHIKIEKDE